MALETEVAAVPAENSGTSSGRKPRKPPAGRRFKPGASGNPGGRPKSAAGFREACRDAADAFVRELVRRASTPGEMTTRELIEALPIVADRGGYLAGQDAASSEALKLRALVSALALEGLTDQQRAAILADYQAKEAAAKAE